MNAIPRVLAGTLLVAVMSPAVAQSTDPAPPQEPPKAESTRQPEASGDVGKEVAQAMDAIRAYSAERRAEAVADAKRAAEALDAQMQRLQEQTDQGWDRMSQAAKTRSQATMKDLRERRNALAEWSGGMRHSSAAAWAEVRGGFVKSYQELAEAIRNARTQFDRDSQASPDRADAADEASDTEDERKR